MLSPSMCPLCKSALQRPDDKPWHTVNPVTQRPRVADPRGRLICPDLDCLTLWQRETVHWPWRVIETKGGMRKRSRPALSGKT